MVDKLHLNYDNFLAKAYPTLYFHCIYIKYKTTIKFTQLLNKHFITFEEDINNLCGTKSEELTTIVDKNKFLLDLLKKFKLLSPLGLIFIVKLYTKWYNKYI